jgi:two-component system phosphate regulon sensor histidine kinase PhoR
MLSMVGDQVSVAIENAALYDRLRSTMEKLEQTVQERTSELQAALEQARQADQAKTAFVSDVSHELRTPLSNIRLYLDLLVYGKQERFQEYLATLNRETDRLAGLIEDLLAISRLDAGSYGTNFETVDLNSLARGLVLDRERLCAERKLKLQFSAASIPAIQADIHMISQAIASMLTNAMSYTRAGGSIQVATGLREAEGERWVILEVKDTGIGIPVEEQPRIFERFYRGSASKEMAAPGTGLGLAIAKEIIDKHGGKLTFKSAVGRGSTFTLWLPAELEDA